MGVLRTPRLSIRANPRVEDLRFEVAPDTTYAFELASGGAAITVLPSREYPAGMSIPEYISGHTVKFRGQPPVEWVEGWRTGMPKFTTDPLDLIGGWLRHMDANARFETEDGPKTVKWHSVNEIKVKSARPGRFLYWTPQMAGWVPLE